MIYLDHAATTCPKPAAVVEAVHRALAEGVGNPGRSGHQPARRAEQILAECRHRLNRFFGGASPDRFVLTLNGTDALNLAIRGIVQPGDRIVTGNLEHNSVRRPIEMLRPSGVQVDVIAAHPSGYYEPRDLVRSLEQPTKLVVLTHGSNVLGTVQPMEEFATLCRERKALLLVDAAQTAGAWPMRFAESGFDMVAAPGHKALFGPTGTGFLYVRPGLDLVPTRAGGTGGDSLSLTQPEKMPQHLEAGTPNVVGIAGLSAGIEFIEQVGVDQIQAHEQEWVDRLNQRLDANPAIERLSRGRDDARLAMATFRTADYSSQELAALLDSAFQIAVRGGLHCAPGVHAMLGTSPDGAVRASGSWLSPLADVDAIADALDQIFASLPSS